ncbi:MAG: alkaline phosphatase family protein [Clostridia bacterium]|nr:alkaline phosphatase family protein [Clostridia bacterium]
MKISDSKKVILILIDGMRPDGFENCGNPYIEDIKRNSSYTLNAQTVCPSSTLPCHLSLFYSVSPEVHKVMVNEDTPQTSDLTGLFDNLKAANKKSCIYYSWEPLRQIPHLESITSAEFVNLYDFEDIDNIITERAIKGIKEIKPDFAFIYLGKTDDVGHKISWMSKEYLECINSAIDNVKKIAAATKDEYTIILTADHGGLNHSHKFCRIEDMTIPLFICDDDMEKGELKGDISILDLTPTIADMLGINKSCEWEGKSLISK